MESLPRCRPDGRLMALVMLSIGIHAAIIAQTHVTARDSIGFMRLARHLDSPPDGMSRWDVIRQAEQPPGYSATIWAVSRLMGDRADSVHAMVLSAQLAAAIVAVLTVVPMYFVGRRLFTRNIATLAVGLFQILPVYAQISSDGLADSLFLFLAAMSVWMGVMGLQDGRTLSCLLAGIASGLAYLVRPEGVILAFALGVVLLASILTRKQRWSSALVPGAALLTGLLLVAMPYVVTIGKLTNKPTGENLLNWILGRETEPTWHQPQAAAPSRILVAAFWHGSPDQTESQTIWAAQSLVQETFKSFHYASAILALIGLVALSRRLRQEPALLLLLVLAALHAGLLWVMAAKIGYVSERHTLLLVMLGCFFTAAAVPLFGRWTASWALIQRGNAQLWTVVVAGLLIVTALPSAIRPLHPNRAGHRHAGEWLAQHAEPNAEIVDPFCWAEFYAGRGWDPQPPSWTGATPTYIVLEPNNDNPHARLPLMAPARSMALDREAVYHWPENVPLDQAEVVVFRLATD